MKKAVVVLGMLVMGGNLLWGAEDFTERRESACERNLKAVAWYLPNRLLDLNDVFTFDFGVGAGSTLDAKVTSCAEFGWYAGNTYTLTTGYQRRGGTGYRSGYQYHVGCFNDSDVSYRAICGYTASYKENSQGFSLVDPEADCYLDDDVDFQAIGVKAGVLFLAGVTVHPVQFVDFLAGFVGYDLSGDDLGK